MPMYEYSCPKTEEHTAHTFELLVPMTEQGKPQPCPHHAGSCPAIEYSTSEWMWGKEDIHWSAGLGSNIHGMNQAKKV